MLSALEYRILKRISPAEPSCMTGEAYAGKSKLQVLLGERLLREIRDKVVVDFGCGEGAEAIELAQCGARRVIGVDIRRDALERATARSQAAGVADQCCFCVETEERADVIVSLDSFEHFQDPGRILQAMHDLLAPGGAAVISFGPTWFHPYGGHLFSVFPWAHLLFTEKALIRWRADIRSDGATRFSEVEGGLNQMTIGRFERLVAQSPLRLEFLEAVPIRRLESLQNSLTREFTTAIVRARLVKAGC